MGTADEHLRDLTEIRTLMEKSSKFLSLSGLSGIGAGTIALAGAWVATFINETSPASEKGLRLFLLACAVLFLAVCVAVFFTMRLARKKDIPILWGPTKQLLLNLGLPLGVGGIVCLILWQNGHADMISPSMLVFYGLALVAAAQLTSNEVRLLGIAEILLGLISLKDPESWYWTWTTGFGILHIVYGILMYFRFEYASRRS